nr:ribonuclease H-like domain-containing protein [Tanacetum cinerariifolium]
MSKRKLKRTENEKGRCGRVSQGWGFLLGCDGVSSGSGVEVVEWREEWGRGLSDTTDYAGCKDTFKSTSGGAQFLGENLVSWSLKKQDCTALSTKEAEYVSLFACCA